MSSFDCQVDIPKSSKEQKETPLTVGREFFLSCQGDWPKDLKIENLRLELPETQKYALKLMNFTMRDLRMADLKVVSYQTGFQKIEKLTLTDGSQSLDLSGVEFQVQSVIDPGNQKPEPYGPIGPLSLAWPLVYWIIISLVLTLISSFAGFKIYHTLKRKKWLREIKKFDNVHSPLSQFHSELRKLQRKFSFFGATNSETASVSPEDIAEIVNAITTHLGIFLVRELQIRALDSSLKILLFDLRKYHPLVYQEQHSSLRKWHHEIKKMQAVQGSLQSSTQGSRRAQDLRQLLKESRELAEQIHETAIKTDSLPKPEPGRNP
jgi:hypothetical protein